MTQQLFRLALLMAFAAPIAASAEAPVSAWDAVVNARRFSQPHRISLIDMAKVFKSSREFNHLREELKNLIQSTEAVGKAMAGEIQGLKIALNALDKGSQAYVNQEARLKRKEFDFESFRRDQQRDFLRREAAIYRRVYDQVAEVTSSYAREHRIDVVLRFNSEPLDETDAQKLIEGMNRQVVFFEKGLDITDEIITAINRED
jgi:Skp family chaperone for outer membrane proteins